jgi:hypothetical protein
MCNLYGLAKGQEAIQAPFRAQHDRTGNLLRIKPASFSIDQVVEKLMPKS